MEEMHFITRSAYTLSVVALVGFIALLMLLVFSVGAQAHRLFDLEPTTGKLAWSTLVAFLVTIGLVGLTFASALVVG